MLNIEYNNKLYAKIKSQGKLINTETKDKITLETIQYFAKTFKFYIVDNQVITYIEQF